MKLILSMIRNIGADEGKFIMTILKKPKGE
jgi:hypothetical protein